MSRREIRLSIIVVVLAVVAIVLYQNRSANFKQLEPLLSPQIRTLPNETMLVVEAKGDPAKTAKPSISQLYKDYYELRLNGKRLPRVAPRARWNVTDMATRDTWQAQYALPLPVNMDSNTLKDKTADNPAKIVTWQYGDVAEILHIGPYETESSTIQTLETFITDNGYKTVGELEEEYLKGPGMFLKGNPKNYYTILRFRVTKN